MGGNGGNWVAALVLLLVVGGALLLLGNVRQGNSVCACLCVWNKIGELSQVQEKLAENEKDEFACPE